MNRLPNPFRLATSILPSNNPTRPFTIESPSPTPSSAIALGSLSNAVKMRVCSSSSIPVPVSSTISVNTPWSNCVRTVTLPRSVNLIALDNKLLPICIILSLSPITTASSALSTFSKRFFPAASGIKFVSKISVTAHNLNGTGTAFSPPLSNRKNPNREFSMEDMCPATCRMFRLYSLHFDTSLSVESNSA